MQHRGVARNLLRGTKRGLGTADPQQGPGAEPRWVSEVEAPRSWRHILNAWRSFNGDNNQKYTTQGKLTQWRFTYTDIHSDYRLENTETCWKQRKRLNRSQQNSVNELKWLGTGFAALIYAIVSLSYHRMQFILMQ